ncbi:MAG: cation diffusion facilitator family transporter [Bacteroidia bacterium]|nr:cation diffusion facilitator family transporter [Bacteroidia bacterium]
MAGTEKGPIYAAVAANIAIAIAKFVGSFISGSAAMLSEGIHSLVDSGNGLLLLYGIQRSKIGPDEEHPMGHGKELYFWSLVVAILIFALGGGVSFIEGYNHVMESLSHEGHLEKPGDPTLNYIILVLAMIFEGAALFFALRSFNKERRKRKFGFWEAIRKSKDPSRFAVIFEDTAALLGLMVAMAGVWLTDYTGNPIYDGIASIVIGVILAVIAVILASETKALLIGESALPEVRLGIEKIVEEDEEVFNAKPPITMHFGPDDLFVALDVEFKDNLKSDEIEEVVRRIENNIREKYPIVKKIYVEAQAVTKLTKGGANA